MKTTSEYKNFETWATKAFGLTKTNFERKENNKYRSKKTQLMWDCWQNAFWFGFWSAIEYQEKLGGIIKESK